MEQTFLRYIWTRKYEDDRTFVNSLQFFNTCMLDIKHYLERQRGPDFESEKLRQTILQLFNEITPQTNDWVYDNAVFQKLVENNITLRKCRCFCPRDDFSEAVAIRKQDFDNYIASISHLKPWFHDNNVYQRNTFVLQVITSHIPTKVLTNLVYEYYESEIVVDIDVMADKPQDDIDLFGFMRFHVLTTYDSIYWHLQHSNLKDCNSHPFKEILLLDKSIAQAGGIARYNPFIKLITKYLQLSANEFLQAMNYVNNAEWCRSFLLSVLASLSFKTHNQPSRTELSVKLQPNNTNSLAEEPYFASSISLRRPFLYDKVLVQYEGQEVYRLDAALDKTGCYEWSVRSSNCRSNLFKYIPTGRAVAGEVASISRINSLTTYCLYLLTLSNEALNVELNEIEASHYRPHILRLIYNI